MASLMQVDLPRWKPNWAGDNRAKRSK